MLRNLPGYVANLWLARNPHIVLRTLRGFYRGLVLKRYTLRSIEIFPTMACNISCQMCSVEKFKRSQGKAPLRLDEYERLAAESAPLGLSSVTILGGEPMLVRNLEDIITAFRRRHVYVHMVSNSTMSSKERLASLKQAGLHGVCFSLDSLDRDTNDMIRGYAGHYDSVFRAIEDAKSLGLVVSLAPVFFPGNVEVGIDVVRFCKRNGLGASGTQASPVGSWEGMPILSKEENNRIRELLREYPRLTFDWALSYLLKPNCPAGKEKLAITTHGDVCGCSINPISFGNVREESLKSILLRMQSFSQFKKNSPYCLAGEDEYYVERYLRPVAKFEHYPVSFDEHPNIDRNSEPELFRKYPLKRSR